MHLRKTGVFDMRFRQCPLSVDSDVRVYVAGRLFVTHCGHSRGLQRRWIEPRKPFRLGTVSALEGADMARDIGEWLEGLGLNEYLEAFFEDKVDLDAARDLTEADLKDLGIPMGPRKKLLRAIAVLGDGRDHLVDAETLAKLTAEDEPPQAQRIP